MIKGVKNWLKAKIYKKHQVFFSTIFTILGFCIYKKNIYKYGKNTNFIFLRGATGDTFLVGRWIKFYLQERKIQNYVFIGDAGSIKEILELYGYENVIKINHIMAMCFQQFIIVSGGNEYINSMFLWPHSRYFNRCRVRMMEPFTFLDTYMYYVFGFKNKIKQYTQINFPKISTNYLRKYNIEEGKTVILAIEANSVKVCDEKLWLDVIRALENCGYKILINTNDKSVEEKYKCETIFFPYRESVSVLEFAGIFIGLRSGLCDIISISNCKKIILYPKLNRINYSEHRSDINFSSLKALELCSDVIEVDSRLIMNITDSIEELSPEQIKAEIKVLVDFIISKVK